MLVKFKCKAYEDTIYFADIAKHLLSLMGHSGAIPGAISAAYLPQALASLKQGIAQENAQPVEPVQDLDDDEEPEIDLNTRAIPLINLLQAAIENNCDVMWDAA